nr:hypothetical protein [Variovorax boronicumulans]
MLKLLNIVLVLWCLKSGLCRSVHDCRRVARRKCRATVTQVAARSSCSPPAAQAALSDTSRSGVPGDVDVALLARVLAAHHGRALHLGQVLAAPVTAAHADPAATTPGFSTTPQQENIGPNPRRARRATQTAAAWRDRHSPFTIVQRARAQCHVSIR